MGTDPNLLRDLEARGLIQDSTDREALAARLVEGPITVYCGFDPTAPSLHVGNLIGLLTLRRFQQAGHRPLPLAGGATGMIGDPSGRSDERSLLDDDALQANLAGIVPSLRKFLDFDPSLSNAAKLLDNRAWTVSLSMLEFLRDIGRHVTVNQMTAKESVRARLASETGLSYTEFSYMLLQANDYRWLYENEACELQIGGSDQWGNIALGVDLVRRTNAARVHGLTFPLLLKRDGTKYGKTAGGETQWLNADLMSPYRFYQAWIQADDADLPRLLAQLTFLSLDEVADVVAEHAEAPHTRVGQRRLAHELTSLVHSPAAAVAAEAASEVVFGGSSVGLDAATFQLLAAEVPTTVLDRSVLDEPDNLVGVLVSAGVAKSRSEAGRLLRQNGISVNDEKVPEGGTIERQDLRHERFALVRRGKKQVHLVMFDQGSGG
ncbi:MAG: tyrosine--tRNA ligase [Acidimicrobiales bacterium]